MTGPRPTPSRVPDRLAETGVGAPGEQHQLLVVPCSEQRGCSSAPRPPPSSSMHARPTHAADTVVEPHRPHARPSRCAPSGYDTGHAVRPARQLPAAAATGRCRRPSCFRTIPRRCGTSDRQGRQQYDHVRADRDGTVPLRRDHAARPAVRGPRGVGPAQVVAPVLASRGRARIGGVPLTRDGVGSRRNRAARRTDGVAVGPHRPWSGPAPWTAVAMSPCPAPSRASPAPAGSSPAARRHRQAAPHPHRTNLSRRTGARA